MVGAQDTTGANTAPWLRSCSRPAHQRNGCAQQQVHTCLCDPFTPAAPVAPGAVDAFATEAGAKELLKAWNASVVYKKTYDNAGHMDFLW